MSLSPPKTSMENKRLVAAVLILLCGLPLAAQAATLQVYVASSLGPAIEKVAGLFQSLGLGSVSVNAASSSVLARQIENGAPADLFISANIAWIDYLDDRELLAKESRQPLTSNQLVLIAPKKLPLTLNVGPDLALAKALAERPLAICDPDHVPCGIYAREALTALRVWEILKPKAVRAANARVALAWVARGEAGAGVVYASDAKGEPRVMIVGLFSPDTHTPIVYEAAMPRTYDRNPAAFIKFLTSNKGQEVLKSFGFTPLAGGR